MKNAAVTQHNTCMPFYTAYGERIRSPEAYARTGKPMFTSKSKEGGDINRPTVIYKLELEDGKIYIGKSVDVERRLAQHCTGNGAKVTQKFKPETAQHLDKVPGFFSDEAEQVCCKDCGMM
eukprot:TRINITY_DN5403_c0_g2_i1.p1 TRINITY_DN5403_c0_g2~~TRINITY_DN5403_c0_g2_i1.p1  ORF type:complete len:121 (-),score=23.97 TRINITY_DN5403_c0_g2_i1:407-769(-)